MKRSIQLKIVGQPFEIRMGAPYNTCEIDISGTSLDLPKHGWQDKFAWSSDNKYLALIQWNFDNNEPGFEFYIIDTHADRLIKSHKIEGLINDVKIKEGKILYNKFMLDRERSKPGELCCHTIEEYEIKG